MNGNFCLLTFDAVLSVYDDLGDVQRIEFNNWWSDKAISVFGHEGAKPKVLSIDNLKASHNQHSAECVQTFVDGGWQQQAQPDTALVSIPLGLSKAQITRQLKKYLRATTNNSVYF